MKRLIYIAFALFVSLQTMAQDIHFSQFYFTPLFTNPAYTGRFDGTYRFNGIIRRQWASVSAQPYQTFGGSIDMNSPFNLKGTGIGLNIVQDIAGLSAFSTFGAQLSLSTSIRITGDKSWIIGGGGSYGYLSQSVDYSKLKFDDQYSGKFYDPTLISIDYKGSVNYAWTNVSLGGFVQKKFSPRSQVTLGYSTYNLFQQNRGTGLIYEPTQRHSAQVLTSFKLTKALDLQPSAQVMIQGEASEYLVGTGLKFYLKDTPLDQQAIMLSSWARVNDAGIVGLGFQKNQLTVGATYDFNYSPFKVATNYRGGWEFAVIYTIATVRENIKRLRACPDYL